MRKRILGLVLATCMLVGLIPFNVAAATTTCTTYSGTNVESQDYDRWASPIASYLSSCDDGTLMRVQYGSNIEGLLVEYYDTEYNLLNTKSVAEELPIFGAFYETDANYFLLTGQANPEESSDVEVFRITKYDKDWTRITSTGLYGSNTTVPFDAGSARMDVCGDYLLIRTAHEMYMTEDGLNHQANVTIQLDMETMEITDYLTDILNSSYGYISHSFNQFIKVENNQIVAVDHGDALPRSLVLTKYNSNVSTGKFMPSYYTTCDLVDILTIPGAIGENVTGATLGGFEISDSAYLVAGNSVIQDDNNLSRATRNVFVASVDKTTSAVTMNWITNYAEGNGTTSTPHMVKIADNRFLLLWSRNNLVYYTEVDANGNQTGNIYNLTGNLSDCVPLVANDKLIWYTWKNGTNTFYDIDLTDLSDTNVTIIENGHKFDHRGITDGYATLVCKECGTTEQIKVVTSYTPYWQVSGTSYSSASPSEEQLIGASFNVWIPVYSPEDANLEMVFESSNPSVLSVTPSETRTNMANLTMSGSGTATLSIYPKYNPSLVESFTFYVNDHIHEYEWISTSNGIATLGCIYCDATKTEMAATSMDVWWNETDGSGYYYSSYTKHQAVGNNLYCWGNISPDDANEEIEVIVSDSSVVSYTAMNTDMGVLQMLKTGKVNVTVQPKYNPALAKIYTIWVDGELAISSFTADKASPQIVGSEITLNAEAVGGSWDYTYRYYYVNENNETIVIQDYATNSSCVWKPETAGSVTVYVDVKDSNGTIVTQSMDYEVTALKLKSAALALENDISIVFRADASLNKTYYHCYINVVQELENGETKSTMIPGVLNENGTLYNFEYTGVNAKEVGDVLSATIYAYDSDGNLVQGQTLENYSVKKYCMNQLSKTDAAFTAQGLTTAKQKAFRTLLTDLLNYASEAQVYFGYKENSFTNADLTDTQKAYASSDEVLTNLQNVSNPKHIEISDASATWNSATLVLLSKTTMRLKFTYDGDISQVTLKASVIGGSNVDVTEFTSLGNHTYYAYFDGFTAFQFSSAIDFVLEENGKAISNTLRYSVESYASKNKNHASLGSIVSAMMKYGKAASTYKQTR